jgi:hypothetical protein
MANLIGDALKTVGWDLAWADLDVSTAQAWADCIQVQLDGALQDLIAARAVRLRLDFVRRLLETVPGYLEGDESPLRDLVGEVCYCHCDYPDYDEEFESDRNSRW